MSFKVKVTWGKETFEGVEVDTTESPDVFRAQLYALTQGKTASSCCSDRQCASKRRA